MSSIGSFHGTRTMGTVLVVEMACSMNWRLWISKAECSASRTSQSKPMWAIISAERVPSRRIQVPIEGLPARRRAFAMFVRAMVGTSLQGSEWLAQVTDRKDPGRFLSAKGYGARYGGIGIGGWAAMIVCVRCPRCNQVVPDEAHECPACGKPRAWDRHRPLIFGIVFGIAIEACMTGYRFKSPIVPADSLLIANLIAGLIGGLVAGLARAPRDAIRWVTFGGVYGVVFGMGASLAGAPDHSSVAIFAAETAGGLAGGVAAGAVRSPRDFVRWVAFGGIWGALWGGIDLFGVGGSAVTATVLPDADPLEFLGNALDSTLIATMLATMVAWLAGHEVARIDRDATPVPDTDDNHLLDD